MDIPTPGCGTIIKLLNHIYFTNTITGDHVILPYKDDNRFLTIYNLTDNTAIRVWTRSTYAVKTNTHVILKSGEWQNEKEWDEHTRAAISNWLTEQ